MVKYDHDLAVRLASYIENHEKAIAEYRYNPSGLVETYERIKLMRELLEEMKANHAAELNDNWNDW